MKYRHFFFGTLACLSATEAQAQSVWDNGNADGLWNVAANWNPDGIPAGAVSFTTSGLSSASLNGSTNYAAGNLTFGNGGTFAIVNATGDTANLNLSGRTVTVSDAGSYSINLTNGGGAGETATGRVNLNNTTFSIATGGKLTLDGRYTNETSAVRTITKSGAGTLELTGTFFGNFLSANVTGGTLELNSSGTNRRLNGITGISAGATVKVKSANTQLATGSSGFFTSFGINSVAGTLDLNGFNLASGNLSGAATGTITNTGAADATLTLGNYGSRAGMTDRSTSYGGIFSDGPTNKLGLTVNSLTGTSPIYRLTLTGTSTHSGTTSVPAGTLRLLGGNIANSPLSLTGTGRLQVGDGTATFSTAGVGGIAQDGTSAIELDVASTGHDQLNTTGTYTYTAGSIEVAVADATVISSGTTVTLVQYGTLVGTPVVNITGISGSPLIPTVNYGTGSNSAITVTFNLPPAGSLLWTGAADSSWTVGGPVNWNNGGTPTAFSLNDKVTFDDSAPNTRLNPQITGDVQPLSVTFANNSKAYVIGGSGQISGAGTISKTGTGSVAIESNNTHVGANTITAGTLKIGNGGTSGALGAGSVANEGTLELSRSDSFTVPNVVSGAGSLVKTSTGTAMLSGTNTYTGATTISAGVLQVGDGGATGSLGQTSGITNNATLSFDRTGTLTVAAPITGSGALVKNGDGTVILGADSTYGGGTIINAGTLQLGSGAGTGSVTGTIQNYGDLAINRSDSFDLGNLVTGSGSLTHLSTGTLRLTAANSYTGETRLVNGVIDLDSGSHLPAGGSLAFIGGNGFVRVIDGALTTLGGLRAVGPGGGTNSLEGITPITVNGGDLLVGPTTNSDHVFDLSYLPAFTYNAPGQTISVGSQAAGGATRTSKLSFPLTTSLTGAALNVQTANGASPADSVSLATATVLFGTTTTLHVDTINLGFNRDTASIGFGTNATSPTVTIRSSDGTGRTNFQLGSRATAYGATQTVTVDFLNNTTGTPTLDALVGTLKIGDYGRGGGQIQNATFAMGAGTLDATEIVLGNNYNNNGNNGVLNSTLTVSGGSVVAPTVTFGTRSNGTLNATINLLAGASLTATHVIAGSGTATRVLNLGNGTLANIAGGDLTTGGITLRTEATADPSVVVSAGQLATFGPATVLDFHYNSSTGDVGTINLQGAATLDATATLALADANANPAPLAVGQKLVLVNYASGSFTGTFSGVADGGTVMVGTQSFVIDYDDPAYGGKAVTATAAAGGSTYASWAAANAGGEGADGDYDKDGVPNAVEYLMGQTGSTFTPNPRPVNGKITWPKDPAAQATWAVQTSTNLAAEGQPGGWTNASTGVTDLGSSIEFTLPTGNSKLFARLKVTVP